MYPLLGSAWYESVFRKINRTSTLFIVFICIRYNLNIITKTRLIRSKSVANVPPPVRFQNTTNSSQVQKKSDSRKGVSRKGRKSISLRDARG